MREKNSSASDITDLSCAILDIVLFMTKSSIVIGISCRSTIFFAGWSAITAFSNLSVIVFTFIIFRTVLWKRFLTAFSLRPGSYVAIRVQAGPCSSCPLNIISSSSTVQFPLFNPGESTFIQRSRTCFPVLPFIYIPARDHLVGPFWATQVFRISSSLQVHGPVLP